ncbi:odorant receptor 33b-like [Acyrthosiphon pisum]|uniref:Odorant receptor n=1 Tax=Acyrthosiphon pisum TaxID=7029 RepID=A0A8R2JU98_ACYPI|nr:odorant receptor 33b-like [Acyrthosiphon pisum]
MSIFITIFFFLHRKYDEFLSIFRPTMLLQVFVVSCSIIFLWFIFLTSFIEDDFTQYMALTSMEAIFGIPFCTFQMYMSCFVFNTLNIKKDSITFALYSSNWTEMDMKFKKLILLTMRMNDAHQQKLQYTKTKIINMEIFYHVCFILPS